MEREKNKSLRIWIDEFWEEIEIQFYGVIGAILFFVLIFFIFQPPWMRSVVHLFWKVKLSAG